MNNSVIYKTFEDDPQQYAFINIYKKPSKIKYYIGEDATLRNKKGVILKRFYEKHSKRLFYQTRTFGTMYAARLLAYAFKPDEVKKFEDAGVKWHADHIDDNKHNDILSNIDVISLQDNVRKASLKRKNVIIPGSNRPVIKICHKTGDIIKRFESTRETSQECNININTLRSCIKNGKMHKGFIWKYDDPDLDGEIWYDCERPEFKGKIKWSNMGRILTQHNIKRYGSLTSNGYYSIQVNNKPYLVSRIIAIEKYYNEYLDCLNRCKSGEIPEVDHIDRNNKNNRPENLRWVTRVENNNNKIYKTWIQIQGISIDTREIISFKSIADAATYLNSNAQCVNDCVKGKTYMTQRHIFKNQGDDALDLNKLVDEYENYMVKVITKRYGSKKRPFDHKRINENIKKRVKYDELK